MKKRNAGYTFGLFALIAGTMLIGAASLTVIFGGTAAFPVEVFGVAALQEGQELAIPAIRAPRTGEVVRSELRDYSLPPELWELERPGGAGVGAGVADPALEAARELANNGRWEQALDAYGALFDRRGTDEIALERARVLSWSGRPGDAADAMEAFMADHPADAELMFEAAQYHWWAGEIEEADVMLSRIRAMGAETPEVASLIEEVRSAYTPDIEAARRWVAENDSWQNRVVLARAYLAESDWMPAVREFDRALTSPAAPDSLYLEMAAVAMAADSTDLSIAALGEYLYLHPSDADARLSLARAYGWLERYEPAVDAYRQYLAMEEDDQEARFELAQILTWMERNEDAGRELRRVALADPTHAPTYRLLGDLARWRGDYELAIANYLFASDLQPNNAEVRAALEETQEAYVEQRLASMPLPLGECTLAFDSFTDSEGFTWVSTHGSRTWRSDWGAVEVAAQQALSAGDNQFATGNRIGGIGASVALFLPVSQTSTLDLLAGTTDYGDFGTYARARVGITENDFLGGTASASYTRGPAVQRAATVAALEAGTTSDLLQASFSRGFGSWNGYSGVEAERLASEFGSTYRYAATLSASRPLTGNLSLNAGISAITTTGDTPQMPDGRPLYWTPEIYIAPSIGLTYRMRLGDAWSVAASATPSYAYVRERTTGQRRFGQETWVPSFGAGLELGYTTGDWEILGIADLGGSVDATGYRASTIRVEGSYRLGEP